MSFPEKMLDPPSGTVSTSSSGSKSKKGGASKKAAPKAKTDEAAAQAEDAAVEDSGQTTSSTQSRSFRNRKSAGGNTTVKRAVKKYCLCQQPYNRDLFYIQCDACNDWFHGSCVKLPENLGEQIEKWFCPACVEKDRVEIKWKPDCARPDCKERVRTDNIYCSEDCAVMVAESQLKQRIAELPRVPISRNSTHPLRSSYQEHRNLLLTLTPGRERIIRCLEFRQLLIDECIDRSFKYALDHPESPICGFDERIVTDWIPSNPDFLKTFDSMPLSDYFVSQLHLSPTSPSKDDVSSPMMVDAPTATSSSRMVDGFDSTVCKDCAKCVFHQEWQLLKSNEVAAELEEHIKLYCLGMQKQVELSIRLLAPKEALALSVA